MAGPCSADRRDRWIIGRRCLGAVHRAGGLGGGWLWRDGGAVFAIGLAWPAQAAGLSVLAMLISGVVAGGGFAAVPWLNQTEDGRALANGALPQLGNIGIFAGTPVLAALGAGASLPLAIAVGGVGALVTAIAYRAAIMMNVR